MSSPALTRDDMTTFDTEVAAALIPDLLEQFGETVTYIPKTGATRSITALVNRQAKRYLPESDRAVGPVFEVIVTNSGTLGITATELVTAGDQMAVADIPGGALVTRVIASWAERTGAYLTLEVR